MTAPCSASRADRVHLANKTSRARSTSASSMGMTSLTMPSSASYASCIASGRPIAQYRWRISWNVSASVTSRRRSAAHRRTRIAARSLLAWAAPTRYIGMFESTRITPGPSLAVALGPPSLDFLEHLVDGGSRMVVRDGPLQRRENLRRVLGPGLPLGPAQRLPDPLRQREP